MTWDRQSVLERCAVSAATAWGFYLMARFVNHRWHLAQLEKDLQETQAALEHERVKRTADRVGRTRAEQELRAVKVQLQQLRLQLQLQAQLQPQPLGAAPEQDQQDPDPQTQEADQQEEGKEGAAGDGAEAGAGGGADGACGSAEVVGTALAGATQCRRMDRIGDGDGAEAGTVAKEDKRHAVPAAGAPVGEAKRAAAAAAAALAAAGSAMPAFPFRPIGHLQSVFSERNGTPRQPQLVTAARSRLVLSPSVPRACLEGLEQYSHCWVLYVFHANTDLAKYLSPDRSGLKAKIHVPRLNGGRMGVLATRSPHRPSPIGLSTAEIIKVEGSTLVLGGTDIVDGSPVLDIKPYVPFCDCLAGARAPSWVQAEADDEPLAVHDVVIGDAVREALLRAWTARRAHSMYDSAEQFLDLVRQVLSRDIRSVHQRLNVRPTAAATASKAGATHGSVSTANSGQTNGSAHAGATFALRAATTGGPAAAIGGPTRQGGQQGPSGGGEAPGHYHVVLENIYISYDISPTGVVQLYDAWVDPITARQR